MCTFGLTVQQLQDNSGTFLTLLLLSLVTVFGNLIIIIAIVTEPSLRSVSNTYYIGLAAADMLVGLLVDPFMMVS